jgi:hypothetical protein
MTESQRTSRRFPRHAPVTPTTRARSERDASPGSIQCDCVPKFLSVGVPGRVSDVALDCGLTRPGRLSPQYHEGFGERLNGEL